MAIVEERLGNVKDLRVYYKGSGNPEDLHEIIGVSYKADEIGYHIGDIDEIKDIQKTS